MDDFNNRNVTLDDLGLNRDKEDLSKGKMSIYGQTFEREEDADTVYGLHFGNIVFDGCLFVDLDFEGCVFTNVQFVGCRWEGVSFDCCDFRHVAMRGGHVSDTELNDSCFVGCTFRDLTLKSDLMNTVFFESCGVYCCGVDDLDCVDDVWSGPENRLSHVSLSGLTSVRVSMTDGIVLKDVDIDPTSCSWKDSLIVMPVIEGRTDPTSLPSIINGLSGDLCPDDQGLVIVYMACYNIVYEVTIERDGILGVRPSHGDLILCKGTKFYAIQVVVSQLAKGNDSRFFLFLKNSAGKPFIFDGNGMIYFETSTLFAPGTKFYLLEKDAKVYSDHISAIREANSF